MTGSGSKSTNEITINLNRLNELQHEMEVLAGELRNRKIEVQITGSEGDFVLELVNVGTALQSFGEAFATLAEKCATALKQAAVTAEKMDREVLTALSTPANG